MFEVYHSPAFDFHAGALFVFAASCLYAAGPLWLVCLLIPRLRPAWPRAVVLQLITAAIGWLLMLGVLTWDPTTFSAWI